MNMHARFSRFAGRTLGPAFFVAWLVVSLPAAPQHESTVQAVPREGGPHERFLSLNEKVQANQGNVDLVFIGDSITQGWEGAGRAVWEKYYGRRKALNLGIGGDRTQHVLWRLDHGNIDGIQPKVAVLMIGTNNSGENRNTAPEIVEGITAIVLKLRAKLPDTKILLLGIFPRGAEFNYQRGQILQVNQAIHKLEDGQHVFYLDFGHRLIEANGIISKAVMPDYLHLSDQGYALWAELIEPKLAELLGEQPGTATAIDPSGEWIWKIRGPNGEVIEAPLILKLQGTRVTGTFHTQGDRKLTIQKGSLEGHTLRLTVPRERPQGGVMVYEITGEIETDAIRGKVTTNFDGTKQTEEWSARRK